MQVKILFFSLIFLTFGCSQKSSDETAVKLKKAKKVELRYAENFNLKRSGDLFELEIYDPGTKNIVQSVQINPKNNKRIISLTATLNGMICLLNERKRIIGVSSKNYVYDSKLQQRISQGKIREYGGGIAQLSLEKVAAGKPNVILYDFIEDEFPNKDKLAKLGISILPIYDWRESHPLAKAEWIKVVGAIIGKYDEACEIFDEIEGKYNETKHSMQNIGAKPSVICGNMVGDVWITPSGDNYFAKLIKDAGGAYRYADTEGTVSLNYSLERILRENKSTDFWLNPGLADKSVIVKLNPHVDLLEAFEKNTYCYSGNMNKFWESSAARPDLVLDDLIHIFHPEFDPNYTFNYYGKVQ